MAIFCSKKIEASPTLPALLKKKREELGLTFEQIKFKHTIASRYFEFLEQGQYDKLPSSKTYRLSYVRSYAQILGLSAEHCVNHFISEGGIENISPIHPQKNLKLNPFSSWSVLLRSFALSAFVISFLGYLVWQVKTIIDPPQLIIFSPYDGFISKENVIMVEGKTEAATRLLVNGQEVSTNNQGQFALKLDLINGLNTITITANKKHGKTTSKSLSIIFRPESFSKDISSSFPFWKKVNF